MIFRYLFISFPIGLIVDVGECTIGRESISVQSRQGYVMISEAGESGAFGKSVM